MTIVELINAVAEEVHCSRAQFPGNRHMYVALGEEVGEVARALLENDREKLVKECIQVAASAIRIAAEGDADFGESQ